MPALSPAHIDSATASRFRWPTRLASIELAVVVLLLAVSAAGYLLARQWQAPYRSDLTAVELAGPPDLVGFHAMEQNQAFNYRWSSGYSFAQLRHGYHAASSYIASARLRAANPQGPQPLTLLANERPLVTLSPDTAFRTYHVILPPGPDDEATLRFALQTAPFSPPGDVRKLGVIVTGLALQPLRTVEWQLALLVPALLLGLWLWLRWHGASFRATLLICATLAAALLILYERYRPAPLTYPTLAVLTVLAAAVGATLGRETPSRLGLALLSALVSFSGMIWPSWITDDAFISFRYAQNLVAGNGLVYNVGERVEGYTNFLWTILAALALALGGDLIFLSYIVGVILGLAILLLTYWLARQLLAPGWALVAALIVATSQSLLVYTARGAGLETGLFTLLALIGSALYIEPRRRAWCGAVFALATLTRPEGVILMGLTVLHLWLSPFARAGSAPSWRHVWPQVRSSVPTIGTYLLIVVPFFVWRFAYYGDLLPNTFYAKTGGGLRQIARGLGYAGTFALALGGPLLLAIALPFAPRSRAPSWHAYLALLSGVYSAYVIAVGGDHFPGERFFVPLVPWLALLIAHGLAWLYTWLHQRAVGRHFARLALAALLIVYGQYALLRSAAFDEIIRGDDENVWIWRELGWWMADHAAREDSIAALGAGAIPYYADRTTIDLLGLNDKHIARTPVVNSDDAVAGHEKRDPAYVLDVRRPTYIPKMWDEYFGGERALRARYTLVTIQTRYGRELQLWKRRS